ncbi:MAG: class I SAM-dependent methyltransferase [Pseudomonadota bacterium]
MTPLLAAPTLSGELAVCPHCGSNQWQKLPTHWLCESGHAIPTINEFPDFSQAKPLSTQDRRLRDALYDGLLGRYYGFVMPLLSIPVRPFVQSVPHWIFFLAAWVVLLGIVFGAAAAFIDDHFVLLAALSALFMLYCGLLYRHPYFFWLLLFAIPAKVAVVARPYLPPQQFNDVHRRLVSTLREARCRTVLDVSTGSCNSLLRHGWTKLQAQFHGVDLSATMLIRGARNAAAVGVPIRLYIADAQALPFPDNCMDLVLNYGALNGYQDQKLALSEMARVLKPRGVLVCLDEQLYDGAGRFESLYFRRVLAAHDTIDRFPREAMPTSLELIELHQIYQFYYLAIMRKRELSGVFPVERLLHTDQRTR